MKIINDDEIMHYNVKGSKWGYNKGKRNGGRIAQGIKKIGSAISDVRDFLDYDTQEARRANAMNEALKRKNRIAKQHYDLTGDTDSLKYSKYYKEASKDYDNTLNVYNKFQNSLYGKTLKGIKTVRATVSSAVSKVSSTASKALSTVKSTKAYQTGANYVNGILKKLSTSKLMSKATNVGRKIMNRVSKHY